MKKTTICILTFTFFLFSCGKAPLVKQGQDRGPASVSSPQVWGKTVTPESQDILDEIENAPARKYRGKFQESSN